VLQIFSSSAPASFVHVCNRLRASSRVLYHICAGVNTIAPQILARFSCTSVGLLPLARSLKISYRHKSNYIKSGERAGHLRGAALAIQSRLNLSRRVKWCGAPSNLAAVKNSSLLMCGSHVNISHSTKLRTSTHDAYFFDNKRPLKLCIRRQLSGSRFESSPVRGQNSGGLI
jgi:hypothetical protein